MSTHAAHHARFARATRGIGMLRDFLVVLVGTGLLVTAPPSVEAYGGGQTGFAILFGLLPILGGSMALYGLLRRHPAWEVTGAFTIACAFICWVVALVFGSGTEAAICVAGGFAAFSLSMILRGLVVATGIVPPDRAGV